MAHDAAGRQVRLALLEELPAEQRARSGLRREVRMGPDDVELLAAQPEEIPSIVDTEVEPRIVEDPVVVVPEESARDEHSLLELDRRDTLDVVERHRAGGDPRAQPDDTGRFHGSGVEEHRQSAPASDARACPRTDRMRLGFRSPR